MIRRIKENIEEKRIMAHLEDEHKAINKLKYVIEHFILFTMSVSYVMANFTMLVWSIIFVTQRGLVLFIWANLIWIIPNGKAAMLKSSPFLVGFLWLHLGLLYTYSSKLTRSLFIDSVWYFRLSAGSDVSDMAWMHLLIQSTFGILVSCAMRQYFHDKRRKKAEQQLDEIMGARSRFNMVLSRSVVLTTTAGFLWKWLALIWIWMVVMLMIWMEFWGTSNAFRIMFVALAIFLVMTFQLCSFEFWKKSLRIYWWFLIGYAMANFVTFYLYESGMTRRLLLQYVGTEEQFYKFGLERHKYSERYKPLLNPLFFQLAIIIQKNYLQETFDKYTSPLKETEYKRRKNYSPWMKFMYYIILMKNLAFQTLCVHFQKILLLLGWFVCVYDMCAFNMVFAILLTVSCFSGRNFAFKIIYIMSAWNQVLIVLRLLYMNLYTSHKQWDYVGHYTRNGIEYNITLNNAKWLGFQESRLGYRYADFYNVAWSFLFVAAVTLFRVVQIRQVNYRLARNLPTKRPDVIFPGIDYENCHYSSWNMMKYIANFGFYKLGVEISAVVASIVLFIRMDVFSILISLILIGMCTVKRKYKRMVWYLILIGMAILLPFQYFMTLGICPAYWDISLTRYWNENNTRLRLQQFLNQMNLVYPPKAMLLLFDFALFMCVARQWRAFKTEKKFAQRDFPGGSNEEVYHLIDDPTVVNPVPDYVSNTRTSLDIYKYVIFSSSYYVSLLFTFLAGTMRPTFYSFGYILFASMLAWEGRDMFLRPPKGIIFRWNLLICYNILIMLLRSISQIFGCVIIHNITPAYCSIFQVLSLGCVDKLGSYSISGLDDHTHCDLEKGGLGAGWDTACFVFLILQQRVFKSYYFFHIVNDAKAETIIADRGASIIETVMAEKKEQIKKQNKSIKDNMDFKMKKIRLNAKNIAAIRGGDYRSFDQTERNLNIPLLPQTGPNVDPDFDPTDPMACSEFLALLIKTSALSVLEEREYRQLMKQYLKDKVANKKTPMPKKPVPGEPRPSTTEESEHVKGKIMTYLLLLWAFFEGVIVSLTSLFNWGTPLFRQIRSEISSEKNMLKKNPYNLVGERLGRSKIWSPTKTLETIEQENFSPKKPNIPQYDVGVRLSEDEFLKRKGFVMSELLQRQKFAFSIYTKLVRAFLFTLLHYSEWLCYTCIIARHVYRSDFISLPLLIMVFCWGSLTMPKPSKTFWIVVIAYVLITLLIQSFFVMDIADWNSLRFENNIFYPPNIVGLQRNLSTSFAIAMLASLFFHR
ncbi:piezo-type mechanosensitive ion channel component-like [Sitophilus oryzae]|uniref:Piezo-type mechanosensitive ion channel component-like n=1 Tax=Sitophilus oryzae TaxID=7048 RepID=A0A6J2YXD6_SITOR|nr:piezo-type mechanosensitive ion channel component-like [Sitophilus oryzae]